MKKHREIFYLGEIGKQVIILIVLCSVYFLLTVQYHLGSNRHRQPNRTRHS